MTNHLLGLSLPTSAINSVMKNPAVSSPDTAIHGTTQLPCCGRCLAVRDGLENFGSGTLESEHTVVQDVSGIPNVAPIRTVR